MDDEESEERRETKWRKSEGEKEKKETARMKDEGAGMRRRGAEVKGGGWRNSLEYERGSLGKIGRMCNINVT